MPSLYGMHDAEGQSAINSGGWCLGLVELKNKPRGFNYGTNLNWLLRLDWGYDGNGTFPELDTDGYINNLGAFVRSQTGATRFIIGNEPNHPQEWPNGKPISPADYARVYVRAYQTIKSINSNYQVIVGAIAPYREGWKEYLKLVCSEIKARGIVPDGFAIHAYLRSEDPVQVADPNLKATDGPLKGDYWGFLTYRDAFRCIPLDWLYLPTYITEFDEMLPDGWVDQNTGVVKAVYQEVNDWNSYGVSPLISCAILYRYPNYDKWQVIDKHNVLQDFAEAQQKGYGSPTAPSKGGSSIFIPEVEKPPSKPQESGSDTSEPNFDLRAKKRGVRFEEAVNPNWEVASIRWLDEKESQGRHHIYFDTLDENGNRITGVPITINWTSGSSVTRSEEKKGEPWAANFPMSPSKNDYSVKIGDGSLSDVVSGIGMGADTPSGYNPGIHTSTEVIFRKRKANDPSITPEAPNQPPSTRIELVHPIKDPAKRVISENWGEDPEFYSTISDSGVPLKGHNGLDFAVPEGTPVRAAADGVVGESTFMDKGYGNYIKLIHSWGETLYGHLSQSNVKPGDSVKAGDVIGLSGSTGLSTGPHLHFGMRKNPYNRQDGWAGYIDPSPYLNVAQAPPVLSHGDVLSQIKAAAASQNIDWRLLASLIWAESSFNPNVEGGGLGQIEEGTWKEFAPKVGADYIYDTQDNLNVAAAYLKYLIGYYKGDLWKAVLAYNYGIGNVDAFKPVPIDQQKYQNKVMHGFDLLTATGA